MSNLASFKSGYTKAWSKELWDGLIDAIQARLAPLEEQLDIQRATTDAIVRRGLTVIEELLAPQAVNAGEILDQIESQKMAALVLVASIQALLDAYSAEHLSADLVDETASRLFLTPTLKTSYDGYAAAIAAKASAADLAAAIDALKGGVGPAYDTLVEIAAKLSDDDTAIAAIMTALAARLRVDTDAQGLDGAQKSNARTNLGLGTAAVKNTGTAAGNVVEVQAGGKLPALDGADVTNVGKIVQTVYAEYTAQTDLSALIPYDNTVPQNTEGTQILSASITPSSATNRVRAMVFLCGTVGGGWSAAAGLFRGGASAIAAKAFAGAIDAATSSLCDFVFEDVPGVTSALTYTVRVGPASGTAVKLNNQLGGSQRCVLILEEIRP